MMNLVTWLFVCVVNSPSITKASLQLTDVLEKNGKGFLDFLTLSLLEKNVSEVSTTESTEFIGFKDNFYSKFVMQQKQKITTGMK